jgi:hypothetical protein
MNNFAGHAGNTVSSPGAKDTFSSQSLINQTKKIKSKKKIDQHFDQSVGQKFRKWLL